MTTTAQAINSYECWVRGHEEHPTIVHHTNRGRAKVAYYHQVRDVLPNLPFIQVCARKIGAPVQTGDFQRVANYRNVPFARIGMSVRVEGEPGKIIGHNCSSNFDVLFESGRFKERTLNCHPHYKITYYTDEGREIASFDN